MSEANAEDGPLWSWTIKNVKMSEAQYRNRICILFFVRPEFRQMKRMEQAEDSSPDPSSSACEIRNQSRFCGNHSPRKLLPQNRVRIIVPPPARILGGQNTKEKCPFHFQEKFTLPNQKSKRHFSLVLPSEARQWRNDTSVRFSFKPPRPPRVRHHLF